tara:strand:+ start:831 stop:2048 length:1218 start_codon:yes stop_codon:yes gene_type:complete
LLLLKIDRDIPVMKRILTPAILMVALALTTACKDEEQAAAPGGGAPQAVAVTVYTVEKKPLQVSAELPGRTSAFRIAEVRPQVTGIIQQRLFEEGALVEAGEQLYQIDPAPYEAELASAKADLQRAEASVANANARVNRYDQLVRNDVVSRQNYDDAIAAQRQGRAEVAAAKAAVDAAEINLQYTRVSAPIAGRTGKSAVTEGALVTANQDTLMTVVQQLDPIYVDMTQSASQLLKLRREIAQGQLTQTVDRTPVSLIIDGGNDYELQGELKFSDVTVDESTATVQLRAVFPNPNNELLPGLFVKAVIDQAVRNDAILVPQRAVGRGPNGQALVWVLGEDNTVSPKTVTTEQAMGNAWLIADGLDGGESIVIEGLQKVSPGAKVDPAPSDFEIDLTLETTQAITF